MSVLMLLFNQLQVSFKLSGNVMYPNTLNNNAYQINLNATYSTVDAVKLSTTEIFFSPPVVDPKRCVNISFGDSDFEGSDQFFTVIFTPSNDNDVFVGGSVANVTIIDDEGTKL